jgi:serine/threonine protein kinase
VIESWEPDFRGVQQDNILVSPSGRACLADFGFGTVGDSVVALRTSTALGGGTTRYSAPELLDPEENIPRTTRASDMYAFGCVCYEVRISSLPDTTCGACRV